MKFPRILAAGILFVSCGPVVHVSPSDRVPVSVFVEVTDAFGYPIQGVEVHLLRCWQEWSGETYRPRPSYSVFLTDSYGQVGFGPFDLAEAGLGFLEDPLGNAALGADPYEDEAVLDLRIGAPSLGWVDVRVDLEYGFPSKRIAVEFDLP